MGHNNLLMKILRSPWKTELLDLVQQTKRSIKVTSPYIKANICHEIIAAKARNVGVELITSFKLSSIHDGSIDLAGIEHILENEGAVKNFSRLHSKIYLFDNEKAVITSANLTNGGLLTNFEYGILIDDAEVVREISDDFQALSEHKLTGLIQKENIDLAKEILSKIPKVVLPKMPDLWAATPEFRSDIIPETIEAIRSSLAGWKLSVFDCLQALPQQIVTLAEVYSFEGNLRERYPNNQNIQAKIRQQLQFLRDSGLVEFMANGQYRKLWS